MCCFQNFYNILWICRDSVVSDQYSWVALCDIQTVSWWTPHILRVHRCRTLLNWDSERPPVLWAPSQYVDDSGLGSQRCMHSGSHSNDYPPHPIQTHLYTIKYTGTPAVSYTPETFIVNTRSPAVAEIADRTAYRYARVFHSRRWSNYIT